ncbi:MAG TPA: response regulator [Gaiellaceae bacterium]|nr:response regulator [Gaiellaceae bacterium]
MTKILVIDDEAVIRDLMLEILEEAGYESCGAPTAEFALDLLADPDFDLVVSDVVMPGLSGLELLEQVRTRRPALPVVLVTGAGTYSMLTEALARGADGLVLKPFSHSEFLIAIAAVLERSGRAERDMSERLLAPGLAMALANANEARDAGTHGHCERLTTLALWIAARLGLAAGETETVRLGAILHDVGKIGIPDRVLLKPGLLTAEELGLMRTHPLVGDRVLEPLELLSSVRPVVRHHHERWDGDGYPDGLAGEATPLPARIVGLADAVEAMWARRPYRDSLTRTEILSELETGAGAQWDPELVSIVLGGIESGDLGFTPSGIRVAKQSPAANHKIFSVLLVEADSADAKLARDAIEAAFDDVRVVHSQNAAGALELCAMSIWSLVLIDQQLPGASGIELLHSIRAAGPATPVVMITGEDSEGLAVEVFRNGATDYVIRGEHFAGDLTRRVRTLLEAA